jgi:predicted enzyme related to lactoylglutathione lyase
MGIRVGNITVDCDDVMRVARFWSAGMARPLDDGASEWFASIGGKDPDRIEPAWYFSKVPEKRSAKNRMHVDVFDASPDAIDRLVALGATVLEQHELDWAGHRWTVMQDPEGNEFCVGAKPFTGG